MKEELQNKLINQFPFMQRAHTLEEQKKNGRVFDLYGAFGCEVNDGWFSLLWNLCEEIVAVYENAGISINFKPVQIKEKYGALRFYYEIEEKKQPVHAIDFMGQGAIRITSDNTPLHQEVSNIVRKWEEKSKTVCEVCGKTGHVRKDSPRILTLCDDCYGKKNSR